jgi:Zn-dependent peptidase ImmA (M78 family)
MLDSYNIPSKKAERAANALLAKHFIEDPSDIDLEGILAAENGYLLYKPMTGAQGRIVLSGDSAIITINSNVQDTPKRRFILAHEMGHFTLHKKLTTRTYTCYERDLVTWTQNQNVETEANEFASALLMPSKAFKKQTANRGLSLQVMEDLQATFGTSFTATGIRYTQCGDVPSAIISMKSGLVEFAKFSEDFPGQFIPVKTRIPSGTVANDALGGSKPPNYPVKVRLRDWFNSIEPKHYNRMVYELCIESPRYDLIISLLWTL